MSLGFAYGATVGGENQPYVTGKFYNRSGSTIVRGQPMALDLAAGQSETTTIFGNTGTGRFENLIPPATATLSGPHVIALETIADNASGTCLIYGIADVLVLDDDAGGIDVEAGQPVSLVDGSTSVAGFTANTSVRMMGIALEAGAAATDSSASQYDATRHYRSVLWTGGRVL